MKVVLKRQDQAMNFVASDENGHSVSFDASEAIGGHNQGVRPMQAVLMALGGCSGIDLHMILSKQRQTADNIEIEIYAEREQDKTPALFEAVQVEFRLDGELDESKVKKAVDLSMQKYCSVAKILEHSTTINYRIVLNGSELD